MGGCWNRSQEGETHTGCFRNQDPLPEGVWTAGQLGLQALHRREHSPILDRAPVLSTAFERVDWAGMPQKVEEPWKHDPGLGLTGLCCSFHFPKRGWELPSEVGAPPAPSLVEVSSPGSQLVRRETRRRYRRPTQRLRPP